jgi:hypothetical protein
MKIIACCVCGEILVDFIYGFHVTGIYCMAHAPEGTKFFGDPTSESVKKYLVNDDLTRSPERFATKSAQRFIEYALHAARVGG